MGAGMTGQSEFLQRLIDQLESAGISYMCSGSLSSSFYGNPRATNDMDLVIDPDPEALKDFLETLGSEYYVSRPAAVEAAATGGMFNIIDRETGWKADLIIRKDREYSRTEFRRRRKGQLLGVDTYILTPEDAVLSKLEWAKGRQSSIQYGDAIGILRVQGERLDYVYLRQWAVRLGIEKELEEMIEQSQTK